MTPSTRERHRRRTPRKSRGVFTPRRSGAGQLGHMSSLPSKVNSDAGGLEDHHRTLSFPGVDRTWAQTSTPTPRRRPYRRGTNAKGLDAKALDSRLERHRCVSRSAGTEAPACHARIQKPPRTASGVGSQPTPSRSGQGAVDLGAASRTHRPALQHDSRRPAPKSSSVGSVWYCCRRLRCSRVAAAVVVQATTEQIRPRGWHLADLDTASRSRRAAPKHSAQAKAVLTAPGRCPPAFHQELTDVSKGRGKTRERSDGRGHCRRPAVPRGGRGGREGRGVASGSPKQERHGRKRIL